MQINKDILKFFEQLLGTSKQQNNGNFAFKCPLKNHRKSKLIINLNTQNYNCFACQTLKGKSFYTLLKKINADKNKFKELSKLLNDNYNLNTIEIDDNKNDETIKLPKEFWPFSKKSNSLEYKIALKHLLKDRKIPWTKIHKYNIGFAPDGKYRNRIIIPSYDKTGELNYFTARTYTDNFIKYQNPSLPKTEIIPFELYISWNIPIILVEGFFDAISIDYNSMPVLGKKLSDRFLLKLVENDIDFVYLMMDGDAIEDYIKLIKKLNLFDIDVKPIFLNKNEDPDTLSQKEIFIKCKNAKIFKNEDMVKLKLRYI